MKDTMLRNAATYLFAFVIVCAGALTGAAEATAQTAPAKESTRTTREQRLKDRKTQRAQRKMDSTIVHHLDSVFIPHDQVRVLQLSQKNLDSLPESISKFTGVHTVNLSGNALTSVPRMLAKLPNLRRLILSRNKLASATFDSTSFTMLQHLDLSNNPIDSGIVQLPSSLETIDLSNCGLSTLPTTLLNCSRLTSLNLANNPLASFPSDLPKRLPMLEEITLKDKRRR